MGNEHLYAKAAEELKLSGPSVGLWAKAFAECNGDERAANAMYLRLRVAQLQAEEDAAHFAEEAPIRKAAAEGRARSMAWLVFGVILAVIVASVALMGGTA